MINNSPSVSSQVYVNEAYTPDLLLYNSLFKWLQTKWEGELEHPPKMLKWFNRWQLLMCLSVLFPSFFVLGLFKTQTRISKCNVEEKCPWYNYADCFLLHSYSYCYCYCKLCLNKFLISSGICDGYGSSCCGTSGTKIQKTYLFEPRSLQEQMFQNRKYEDMQTMKNFEHYVL